MIGSVRKTGRLVIVHEASGLCGIAAELAALVATRAFHALRAPVLRLTGPDAPMPSFWVLEQAAVPQAEAVVNAVLGLVGGPHAEAGRVPGQDQHAEQLAGVEA